MELLEKLVEAGVDPSRMMPGTGCCALTDSVRLTAHAVKLGCAGALMLPPFYYKGVSDEGLFRNYAEIVERVGDARLQIYLYHIPQVSQVPISLKLIERLLKAYPKNIAGTKDSSGDWNNTKATLDAFAKDGFDVFPGSETFLLAGLRSRRQGLHQRHRQRQSGGDPQSVRQLAVGRRGQTAGGPGPHPQHFPEISDDPGDEVCDRALERTRGLGYRAPAAGGSDCRTIEGADRRSGAVRLRHARPEGLIALARAG